MDMQNMNSEQSWPKQPISKPKRQRGKRKSKAAKLISEEAKLISQEAKLSSQEARLLPEDRNRARWERKLLQDTKARLRHMDAALVRQFEHLFRSKTSLSASQRERERDDRLRRTAIREIMEHREKAGIEPVGESALWAGDTIDIANELKKKFGKDHFKNLEVRIKVRKSLRLFLEWALQQPNIGGIPSERIEWIRSLLNQTVRLDDGTEVIPRMQAVYYIAACFQVAGVPLIEGIEDYAGGPSVDIHYWLMEQEPAFFEQENFALRLGRALDLDIKGMNKESAQGSGRTANDPVELDDDDEALENFYDEEEKEMEQGKRQGWPDMLPEPVLDTSLNPGARIEDA